jgi:hypothetical protein
VIPCILANPQRCRIGSTRCVKGAIRANDVSFGSGAGLAWRFQRRPHLDLEAAVARIASRKSRHGSYRPKKPNLKTPFATLHQSLPALGTLRWRFTLPRRKSSSEGRSDVTILSILTIFSGANHVDGTPPALAPNAKFV